MSNRARRRAADKRLKQKERNCGPCSVCCTTMLVTEIGKPRAQECEHVGERGCGIYAQRPPSCRGWHCGWQVRALGFEAYEMRPDVSGVVSWLEKTLFGDTLMLEATRPGALETPQVERVIRGWLERGVHVISMAGTDSTRRVRRPGGLSWETVNEGPES